MHVISTMLFAWYLIFLLLKNTEVLCDCGCNINRNEKCSLNDEKENKYSEELNTKNEKLPNYDTTDMTRVNGDIFEMGTNKPVFSTDHEGPARNVTVKTFYLDKFEVSNEEFANFEEATGYETDAESFGDSFIFENFLSEDDRKLYDDVRAVQAPWWIKMKGISWRNPSGLKSTYKDILSHPVVHVSWNDAKKFCEHYGKRLPTEAEWEMACRAGLRQKLYPWGNKLNPKNEHWMNIWQGDFPHTNTEDDGYPGTAPVNEYPPNKFGLYNMAGNVWEWTSDNWLDDEESKVKKGGSFLCHKSYCWRYRCAARSFNTKDSSASNLGFRCAGDVF